MAEFRREWQDGGSLTATYGGSGDGSAVFSSDINEGIDRATNVSFVDVSRSVVVERAVVQEGRREEFVASDGDFVLADGGTFNVLKAMNYRDYLTMEALEDGLQASFTTNNCEYCINASGVWKTLEVGQATESINAGDIISFKAVGLNPTASAGIGRFTTTKRFNLKGNCMSMLFGDEAMGKTDLSSYAYAVRQLFYGNTKLVNVSKDFLPATKLGNGCYYALFMGCSSLKTAPILLATDIVSSAYYYMFDGCSSLVKAPEIPATMIGSSSCRCMFQNCTSLKEAPELPAMTLGSACYYDMFRGCTSLESEITLPATTLIADCYGRMFQNCRSLTKVFLPATQITARCYQQMFSGCTSLNHITALFETAPSDTYTKEWVANVSPNGVFVKSGNATWDVVGVNGVPEGWVVERDTWVPQGCVELDYIESTGTQFLNLGVVFKNTDECYLDASLITFGSDKFILAPSTWNNNNNRLGIGGGHSVSFGYAYGAKGTNGSTLQKSKDTARHLFYYKNKTFGIEDLNATADVSNVTWGGDTSQLRLFYGYSSATSCKVYGYQQYRDGELIIDLAPVLDRDGVACMYDKVSQTFLYNKGTGNFVAGHK